MKILILSYIQLEKEGRVQRAYTSLKKKYDIIVLDSVNEFTEFDGRIGIQLRSSNPILKNVEFTIRSLVNLRGRSFDVVYAHNYFTALLGLIVSKLFKVPLVYDAYELFFPGSKQKFTIRDRIFYFFEKITIKNSSYVITTNEERALVMLGHYCLNRIPTVVDNIAMSRIVLNEGNFHNNRKLKIVYTGYLSNDRNILEFIEIIKLCGFSDKVVFDIFGNGEIREKLEALSFNDDYEFLNFKREYNNDELPIILSKYDVGYLAYPNNSLNNIFCSPNKLYDYVSNGLVVISTENYSLRKIINKYDIGICSNDLSMALNNMFDNYNFYSSKLENFLETKSWEEEEKKLLDVFNNIEVEVF